MVLSETVKEKVVRHDEKVTVTYSSEDSKKQWMSSLSVYGITMKGEYHAPPLLNVTSERKVNLTEMKMITSNVLVSASGVDSKTLFKMNVIVATHQTTPHTFSTESIVIQEPDRKCQIMFRNAEPSLVPSCCGQVVGRSLTCYSLRQNVFHSSC